MSNQLDDFRLQLRHLRDQSAQQPLTFYSKKMTENQEEMAAQAMAIMQPWLDAFVASDRKLHMKPASEGTFVFHIIYDNAKHCRLSIGVVQDYQIQVNAMVGGNFNLQHLGVYSGPLDEANLSTATKDFLLRCYRFLLTGQLAC